MTSAPSLKPKDENSAKRSLVRSLGAGLVDLAIDFLWYFVVVPAFVWMWVIASLTGSVRGIAVAALISLIMFGVYFVAPW
jgi:uncharacterized RDD family membrane protein YckC